jgi:hypothetical protein
VSAADATAVAQKVVDQAAKIQQLETQLKGAADAAQAAAAAAPATVPATPSTVLAMPKLPPPKVVEEAEMENFALTLQVLEHHAIQDTAFPMYYKYLAIRPIQVAKVVGCPIWTQFYPKEAPKPEEIIPRRLLGALNVAMARLAICSEAYASVPADKVQEAVDNSATTYNDYRNTKAGSEVAPY